MNKNIFWVWLCFFAGIAAPSLAQHTDEYIIRDSILVKTPDGAEISAWVARKRDADKPLPTILIFTIYARQNDIEKIKQIADKGYVGVIAYTRGKRYSPDKIVPYEHDGADANAVINWISKQSWSDGRVGMYGGSYNGFASWAATKKLHPALKTIVPSAAAAPGIDVPMHNNVFMNFPFPWTYYVSNNKFLDNEDYAGNHWNDLDWKWYESGVAYRSRDSLMGRPENRIFRRWLDHPAYDPYWQNMIPYHKDFAQITIPVLSTTGYFDGGQTGTLYYMREHLKYRPGAEHYLLIGPYGHVGSQGSPDSVLNGYRIDQAARINIREVIFQWFDYVFKGAPRPAILKDRVNFEVMGANEWRHVPSLNAMSDRFLELYFDKQTLSTVRPGKKGFTEQVVDFRERQGDIHSYYYLRSIISDSLQTNGIRFESQALEQDTELSGRFTGQMQVAVNKKDIDYSVVLFEQMPDRRLFYLSHFMGRASHARSNEVRTLLQPGKKTALPFENTYITSRRLSKGSRLVVIVNVNKSPSEQINYGTGRDVSSETIADAGELLRIKWYNDSFIRLPVSYR